MKHEIAVGRIARSGCLETERCQYRTHDRDEYSGRLVALVCVVARRNMYHLLGREPKLRGGVGDGGSEAMKS
jgi:hypothetical protein